MKKALIVDDIKGWREFHNAVLEEIFSDEIETDMAESAEEGYSKLLENAKTPYDIIITDLQMEDNYAPKLAGEWFVEQIKSFPQYYKTKIIIISASYNVHKIADAFGVFCIPKATARTCISAYEEILKN